MRTSELATPERVAMVRELRSLFGQERDSCTPYLGLKLALAMVDKHGNVQDAAREVALMHGYPFAHERAGVQRYEAPVEGASEFTWL